MTIESKLTRSKTWSCRDLVFLLIEYDYSRKCCETWIPCESDSESTKVRYQRLKALSEAIGYNMPPIQLMNSNFISSKNYMSVLNYVHILFGEKYTSDEFLSKKVKLQTKNPKFLESEYALDDFKRSYDQLMELYKILYLLGVLNNSFSAGASSHVLLSHVQLISFEIHNHNINHVDNIANILSYVLDPKQQVFTTKYLQENWNWPTAQPWGLNETNFFEENILKSLTAVLEFRKKIQTCKSRTRKVLEKFRSIVG